MSLYLSFRFSASYPDLDTVHICNNFDVGLQPPLSDPEMIEKDRQKNMRSALPCSRKRGMTLSLWAMVLMAMAVPLVSGTLARADERDLWSALRSGGHVALLRHAIAPGTGDPDNFVIGDCRTQRNLSNRGRAQAERIGTRFRANAIRSARLFCSQWCRCVDTAHRLKLGPTGELPALNSFFQATERSEPQTRALKAWLKDQDLRQPHVLVTHQVNITALTGLYPASGELVILRRSDAGDLTVIGTIETD